MPTKQKVTVTKTTRTKVDSPNSSYKKCPTCKGTGRVKK